VRDSEPYAAGRVSASGAFVFFFLRGALASCCFVFWLVADILFAFARALRLNLAIHSWEYMVPRHFEDPQWQGAGSSSS
jgi:hypothetical protein